MNIETAKTKFAADVVEALAIALGQLPLRALFQPADGNDDEAHAEHFPVKRRSACRRKCVKSKARTHFNACAKLACASADSHRLTAQTACGAAGLWVHNLSRL